MIEQIDWAQIEACLNQKTSDWKKREEDLQLLINRLDQNDSHAVEFIARNSKSMALQLNDLRSALVKLASIAVEKAAARADAGQTGGLEKFAEGFLKDGNLVKALGSANKVINIHAASAFRALFEHNQVSTHALEAFFNANKDSKSVTVRERIAEAFCIHINGMGKSKDKKIKNEGIVFLKKAIEFLCKDANGNVRTAAKKAKLAVENAEDLLNGVGPVVCSMEEESFDAKTMSSIRDNQKSGCSLNFISDTVKTLPLPRRDTSKGMEIENDDTQPLKVFELACTKKDVKKYKQKSESVLEVLENPKKQIREKIDQISKMNLDDFFSSTDSDEFKRLLCQFQTAKNFELKKQITKLIEGVNIGKFMGTVLNYTEKEGFDKKINYSFFMTRIMMEELKEFIEFFLFRNNAFALKLLLKRFDMEQFDAFISENTDRVQSLLTIIGQNLTDGATDGFIKLNVTLLEKIYQSNQVATEHKPANFSDAFFDKLEPLSPELHKFLQNQKRKLGDKVVFKPNNNSENKIATVSKLPVLLNRENKQPTLKGDDKNSSTFPLPVKPVQVQVAEQPVMCEIIAPDVLLGKATLQVKKSVIKSIQAHLANLRVNKVPYSPNKIFNKTIEMLRCTFDAEDADDELIINVFRLIEEVHVMFEKDKNKCMSVYDCIIDLAKHQPDFKDKIIEFMLASTLRSKIYAHILMCVNGGDNALVIEGLKILISMLRLGKESFNYVAFHKEFNIMSNDTSTVAKELFTHSEVSVRKNVMQFVVACKAFASENVYQKMFSQLTAEQLNLVDAYVRNEGN